MDSLQKPRHRACPALPPDPWSIGLFFGDSPLRFSPRPGLTHPVLCREQVSDVPAAFVADPFVVQSGRQWWMFFEVMNLERGKGEIGLARSRDGVRWEYQQIVLREPFHLSYPCVFRCRGDYFMLPETYQAGAIRLYRADAFPFRWSFVKALVPGPHVDPCAFPYGGRWWMFACSRPATHDTLELYHAEALLGPWRRHPQSPLVDEDPRAARPAGKVVFFEQTVIRYAQDCQAQYGRCVHAFRVLRLDPATYQESPCAAGPVVGPTGTGWNGARMHHVDPHRGPGARWWAYVDGRPSPPVGQK